MRTILLCILISVISHWAWGQDSVLVENRQADTLTAIRGGFLTEEEMEMYYWIFNHGGRGFISAWTIYSDECWADSTKRVAKEYFQKFFHQDGSIGVIKIEYVTEPMYRADSVETTIYYTHREPTFTGFMEFLKRKVKP